MNRTGEIVLAAITLIFIMYTLVRCFVDTSEKKCSIVKFSGSFISFIYIVNKVWEVL